MIRSSGRTGQPSEGFATRTNSEAALERITSAGTGIVVSRTEPLTHREDLNMPAHRKTCLTQLSELTSLCHDPPPRAFSHSPSALKLTAALHHQRQLADRHLFTNARRSTGARSGSCSSGIGLRGNNDRGRSDRAHDTHNAYL
jgi:hypothetical protein